MPIHPSGACIVLCPTGGLEHHWDGVGHEQVHWLGPAASADPLCSSLCRHRALRTADRLHAAHHLPAVQRPLAHESPKGCHRGVPAGYLQVRLAKFCSDSTEWKHWRFTEVASCYFSLSNGSFQASGNTYQMALRSTPDLFTKKHKLWETMTLVY